MTSAQINPSALVARAAGVEPVKAGVASEPGRCCMCGFPHEVGEFILPWEPTDSFTDYGNLLAPNAQQICGWCAALWTQDFTQKYLRSMVCEQGVFPCASNDHIAYWLLNPPEPPYVLFMGDQKRQHVVWRTPVSLSKELILMRFGERLMSIRPAVLREATVQVRALLAITNVAMKKKRKSPFFKLSRDMDSQQHGLIIEDILALADEDPAAGSYVELLNSLTPGEIWGLTSTVFATNPHRPEPALVPHKPV